MNYLFPCHFHSLFTLKDYWHCCWGFNRAGKFVAKHSIRKIYIAITLELWCFTHGDEITVEYAINFARFIVLMEIPLTNWRDNGQIKLGHSWQNRSPSSFFLPYFFIFFFFLFNPESSNHWMSFRPSEWMEKGNFLKINTNRL